MPGFNKSAGIFQAFYHSNNYNNRQLSTDCIHESKILFSLWICFVFVSVSLSIFYNFKWAKLSLFKYTHPLPHILYTFETFTYVISYMSSHHIYNELLYLAYNKKPSLYQDPLLVIPDILAHSERCLLCSYNTFFLKYTYDLLSGTSQTFNRCNTHTLWVVGITKSTDGVCLSVWKSTSLFRTQHQ